MKRLVSVILALVLAVSALASCAAPKTETASTASDFTADLAWLENRLGKVPDNVTAGLAADLGMDMSAFENDGYMIRSDGRETVIAAKTADGLDRAIRKYAKAYENGCVEDVTYHEGARIKHLSIAGRDISGYTVVYAAGEAPCVPLSGYTEGNPEYAAGEFVRLCAEATGISLPLSDTPTEPMIYIDGTDDVSVYGETGFAYRVEGGDLYISGCTAANGCTNGVYHLFDRYLGWENLLCGDSFLREAEHIDLPEGFSDSGERLFDSMEFQGLEDGNTPPETEIRFRTAQSRDSYSYRGIVQKCCHGQLREKWGGIDVSWENPCYSDADTVDAIYQDMYEYLAKREGAGDVIGRDVTYLDMGQGDHLSFCRCKSCSAVMKAENGSLAGPIVRAANEISALLEKDYPGIKLLNFAYHGSNKPPVTAPGDNVYFTFCLDGSCLIHSLDGGGCYEPSFDFAGVMGNGGFSNADYATWLRGWCGLSPNIYVWYYALDVGFSQYSLLSVLYSDLHFFRTLGVKGFMFNAGGNGLGTVRLHHEMLGAMLWEPDMTADRYNAELDRRVELTYGEGSADIFRRLAAYLYLSHARTGCHNCWLLCNLDPENTDYAFMGEHLGEAVALCDELIACAESASQEKHAKRFSLCFIYEGIAGRYFTAADSSEKEYLSGLYGTFYTRMTESGYDMTKTKDYVFAEICPTLGEEAGTNWEEYRDMLK